jgi:hypothetical protein
MPLPRGKQRGSANGCKRSNQQGDSTPRQPTPVGAQFIAHKGARPDHVTGHQSASFPLRARRGIWVEPRKIKAFSSLRRMKRLFCLLLSRSTGERLSDRVGAGVVWRRVGTLASPQGCGVALGRKLLDAYKGHLRCPWWSLLSGCLLL